MALEIEFKKHVFSPAQEKAFKVLAVTDSYKEAAEELHRSEETVKSHAKVIRETLNVKSMRLAFLTAIAQGIVTVVEKSGKTALAISLVVASGFFDDQELVRHTRLARSTRIVRRVNEA